MPIAIRGKPVAEFKQFNQRYAKAYQQQRNLIKQVLAGKSRCCEHCQQALFVVLPGQSKPAGIYCAKGCTAIELEMAAPSS
jgi:hypothetical protein